MVALDYMGEVLRRVLFPTTRGADYASVLVTLAIAATAFFAGVKVSEDTTVQFFAYIGAITLTIFIIRLFFTVPYTMWKERVEEVGQLKLELSKPERLVMEHLAQHRAKARADLAGELEEFQSLAFAPQWNRACKDLCGTRTATIRRLQAAAGLSEAFQEGRLALLHWVIKEAETPDAEVPADRQSMRILSLLQRHLVGDLTAEALALQLPQGIAQGTPQ